MCDRRQQETYIINFTVLSCLLYSVLTLVAVESSTQGSQETREGMCPDHTCTTKMVSTTHRCVTEEHGKLSVAADCAISFTPSSKYLQSYARQLVACCNAQVAGHESCLLNRRYVLAVHQGHSPSVRMNRCRWKPTDPDSKIKPANRSVKCQAAPLLQEALIYLFLFS